MDDERGRYPSQASASLYSCTSLGPCGGRSVGEVWEGCPKFLVGRATISIIHGQVVFVLCSNPMDECCASAQ